MEVPFAMSILTHSLRLTAVVPICLLVLSGRKRLGRRRGSEIWIKATDTRLDAMTISDLSEVIRFAEAVKKGLDEANTEFANQLLASTHFRRARETTKHLLADVGSPDDFRQRREFASPIWKRPSSWPPSRPKHICKGRVEHAARRAAP